MPNLILQSPELSADLVSQRVRVMVEDKPVKDVPLFDIESVVISTSCKVSMHLLSALLQRSIPVSFVDWSGELVGSLILPTSHGRLRFSQFQSLQNRPLCLAIAALIVEAKIMNSRRIIQRLGNYVESREVTILGSLKNLANAAKGANSIEELMGFEGLAAAKYFETYSSFYPKDVPFEKRSRRPPLNAPNSVLSYCYAILYSEAVTSLAASGLDPSLGYLHIPEDGRFSLALDMIEPFRAVVADSLAIDAFSHGILCPVRHFENRNGGVYLSVEGKKKFFVQYEKRMEREFNSPDGSRTTLRRELGKQCTKIKQVIYDNAIFEPFFLL